MIDGQTHAHTHTQATTIPEGQNWPRVKIKTLDLLHRVTTTNLGFDDKCSHHVRQPSPVCSTDNCGSGTECVSVW